MADRTAAEMFRDLGYEYWAPGTNENRHYGKTKKLDNGQEVKEEIVIYNGGACVAMEDGKPVYARKEEVTACAEKLKEMGLASDGWHRQKDTPAPADTTLQIIVSGKYKSAELVYAMAFAEFWPVEGWQIQGYPGFEKPDVSWWRFVPEMPEEVRKELLKNYGSDNV